jgi:hypothetical protein
LKSTRNGIGIAMTNLHRSSSVNQSVIDFGIVNESEFQRFGISAQIEIVGMYVNTCNILGKGPMPIPIAFRSIGLKTSVNPRNRPKKALAGR